MTEKMKDIWDYRDMVYSLVKRELRGRYQKSVLGMLWTFLNPFFQIVIYTFVFTIIFPSSIENYYIYLMTGIIPWNFFTEALGQGAGSVVCNADMTKKIYFPREILTIASVTAKFVNMLLAFIPIALFIIFSPVGLSWHVLLLPLVWITEYIIALGFTLFFASITVYLRDMEYIVEVLLMAWIWATPIMYSLDSLPPVVGKILLLNPMTLVISSYHNLLYYHQIPTMLTLFGSLAEGIVLLIIGEIVFMHLEGNFAEEL